MGGCEKKWGAGAGAGGGVGAGNLINIEEDRVLRHLLERLIYKSQLSEGN